jgi:hypothetical protein
MFFHAQYDPTGSRPGAGTLLLDVHLAGFTHSGGLHQRRPALFMEVLEMRLDAFSEKIMLRFCGVTEFCHVSGTSPNDCRILRESGGDWQQQQQCQSQLPCHVASEEWRGDQRMAGPVHNEIGRCKFAGWDDCRSIRRPLHDRKIT